MYGIYRVLPDLDAEKDGDIRIIDESGEEYLYPKDWFVLITVPGAVEAHYRGPTPVENPVEECPVLLLELLWDVDYKY